MRYAYRRWLSFALVVAGLAGVSLGRPASAAAVAPPTYLWTLIGKTTNDSVVNYYYKSCGLRIHCLAQGFELDVKATQTPTILVVYQIVLYSNRNTGFAQYSGKLPWGLTWATTAQGVVNKLGKPSQVTGGFGTDITYVYHANNGYRVEIELVARHTRDLTANTALHDIKVSRAS